MMPLDPQRVQSLFLAAVEAAGNDLALAEAVAHEPDPAEAAALVDQIDALLRGLPELHVRILEKRLQGWTVVEIANRMGVCRQIVYRALDLLGERLARQDGALSLQTVRKNSCDKSAAERHREGSGRIGAGGLSS